MQSIEEILNSRGIYVTTTVGKSMFPMLRDRQDTVIIRPCQNRAKKYDVVLYKRNNSYVLHRVLKVLPDSYIICGDNCLNKEYGIKDRQIIGKLEGFYRNEKIINIDGWKYKSYVVIWTALYPGRRLLKKIWGKL